MSGRRGKQQLRERAREKILALFRCASLTLAKAALMRSSMTPDPVMSLTSSSSRLIFVHKQAGGRPDRAAAKSDFELQKSVGSKRAIRCGNLLS